MSHSWGNIEAEAESFCYVCPPLSLLEQVASWRRVFHECSFVFHECLFVFQDIVPVDASYEVKELYVQENKLDLAKADAESLPAVQIGKVSRPDSAAAFCSSRPACVDLWPLSCSWTCSGCRCWLKAGPRLWTASWGRGSTCSVFTSTVCWTVRRLKEKNVLAAMCRLEKSGGFSWRAFRGVCWTFEVLPVGRTVWDCSRTDSPVSRFLQSTKTNKI